MSAFVSAKSEWVSNQPHPITYIDFRALRTSNVWPNMFCQQNIPWMSQYKSEGLNSLIVRFDFLKWIFFLASFEFSIGSGGVFSIICDYFCLLLNFSKSEKTLIVTSKFKMSGGWNELRLVTVGGPLANLGPQKLELWPPVAKDLALWGRLSFQHPNLL